MSENDELIRKLTEKNLIAAFAADVLHCSDAQAEVFTKALADRFTYDGVQLQFKGVGGNVAATDPSCTGFLAREYGFLLPAKSAQEQISGIDPDVIARARTGNQTARGQIFAKLHDGKRENEAATLKRVDALLAAKSDDTVATTDGERNNNPFLRRNWNVTAQARLHRSDPGLCARLAKAAGVTLGATKAVM
ncbi:MAG: hypothetical protein ACRECV_02105 [Xanthobacteraceae bacterium]